MRTRLASGWFYLIICGLLFATVPVAGDDRAASPAAPLTADEAFGDIMKYWGGGDQAVAEKLLATAIQSYPKDVRLLFFAAACERSRFDLFVADGMFMRVAFLDRDGVYGKAALMIVQLDEEIWSGTELNDLKFLSRQQHDDPLILWMAAVQCRAHHWDQDGVRLFAKFFQLVKPGPVMAHQTCANMLDALNRSEEALPHRYMALKLEPAAWVYDGLGNTLTNLKRFDEADAAYAKSTSMQPMIAQYWSNWAYSKRQRKDEAGAEELMKKAKALTGAAQ